MNEVLESRKATCERIVAELKQFLTQAGMSVEYYKDGSGFIHQDALVFQERVSVVVRTPLRSSPNIQIVEGYNTVATFPRKKDGSYSFDKILERVKQEITLATDERLRREKTARESIEIREHNAKALENLQAKVQGQRIRISAPAKDRFRIKFNLNQSYSELNATKVIELLKELGSI